MPYLNISSTDSGHLELTLRVRYLLIPHGHVHHPVAGHTVLLAAGIPAEAYTLPFLGSPCHTHLEVAAV